MVAFVLRFLNRPLAEDFSLRHQLISSIQGGVYVFVFIYLFIPVRFAPGQSTLVMLGLLSAGIVCSTLLANYLVPALLPRLYNEDRWTIGKHILHTIFVLCCISLGNYLVLLLTGSPTPSFGNMLVSVTLIGFFPITLSVMLAQQRQLKRHLRQAAKLNQHLPALVNETQPKAGAENQPVTTTSDTESITLVPTTGKDRLTVHPDQLLAIESVGNYLDIYWLNGTAVQKTNLRLTLKDAEAAVVRYPQFFRSHRAFVVNLNAVQHTTGNARGYQLTIRDLPMPIPVSRGYVDAFEAKLDALNPA